MKSKQKSNLTTLAILTMLTLLTWVSVEAYQRFTKKDFGNIPPEILTPLQPNLDKKVLDLIETRKTYSDEEISHFVPSTTAKPAVSSPVPTPASSQSAQIKTASPSAQTQ